FAHRPLAVSKAKHAKVHNRNRTHNGYKRDHVDGFEGRECPGGFSNENAETRIFDRLPSVLRFRVHRVSPNQTGAYAIQRPQSMITHHSTIRNTEVALRPPLIA